MIRSSQTLSFLASLLVVAAITPLPAQQTAVIDVNTGHSLGPVNRLIFGQNIEAADNAHIFSSDKTDPNLIQTGNGVWDPAANAPNLDVLNDSKAIKMSVLRYPGGCYAHNFDWRKTVGPDAKKAGWLFGLDEYLSLCRAIGAVPLITFTDYALPADQLPENAAEMVEYLNSPATPAHPWALKRKEWGHPEPYNVTWFELGNESIHGNHRLLPRRQYSAEQYAAYANATAAAMRKVDPRIKLGIVMVPSAGNDVDADWNHTVVKLAGRSADFIIIHMYAPQGPMTGITDALRMQTMMVAPHHVEERLMDYHRMIRQQLGHDLPLAITEFNGTLDQTNYSFTLGAALEASDLVRVFLKPESNVALATYWDYINSPFGLLKTNLHSPDGKPETQEPGFLMYQLWADHFGTRLVDARVDAPRDEFAGAGTEQADKGDVPQPRQQIQRINLDQYTSMAGTLWPKLLNVQLQMQGSDLTAHLNGLSRSIYPLLARIPRPVTDDPTSPVELAVSFDAKFTPDPGSPSAPMGLGLIDSRGWNQTRSGIGVDSINSEMRHYDGTYRLTPQTTSVDLSLRLMANGAAVSGTLEVHNLQVTSYKSGHDTAYPLLTSTASTSADGRTAYVLVINKSPSAAINTTIHLANFPATKGSFWEINGPSLTATSGISQTQSGVDLPVDPSTGNATHVFPPHSMTAIEFARNTRRENIIRQVRKPSSHYLSRSFCMGEGSWSPLTKNLAPLEVR